MKFTWIFFHLVLLPLARCDPDLECFNVTSVAGVVTGITVTLQCLVKKTSIPNYGAPHDGEFRYNGYHITGTESGYTLTNTSLSGFGWYNYFLEVSGDKLPTSDRVYDFTLYWSNSIAVNVTGVVSIDVLDLNLNGMVAETGSTVSSTKFTCSITGSAVSPPLCTSLTMASSDSSLTYVNTNVTYGEIAVASSTSDFTVECQCTVDTTIFKVSSSLDFLDVALDSTVILSQVQNSVITCKVTNAAAAVTISWLSASGANLKDTYTVSPVTAGSTAGEYHSTLTLTKDNAKAATAGTIFTCQISSGLQPTRTNTITRTISLDKYTSVTVTGSKSLVKKNTGTVVSLSCTVTGLSSATTVTWRDSVGSTISNEANKYGITQGSHDTSTKVQVSVLTVTSAFAADTTFTCEVLGESFSTTIKTFGSLETTSVIVQSNKATSISTNCTVSDIGQSATFVWKSLTGIVLSNDGTHSISSTSYNSTTRKQVSTLTVSSSWASASGFLCQLADSVAQVELYVVDLKGSHMNVTNSTTHGILSCNITSVNHPPSSIVWKNESSAVVKDNDTVSLTTAHFVGGIYVYQVNMTTVRRSVNWSCHITVKDTVFTTTSSIAYSGAVTATINVVLFSLAMAVLMV